LGQFTRAIDIAQNAVVSRTISTTTLTTPKTTPADELVFALYDNVGTSTARHPSATTSQSIVRSTARQSPSPHNHDEGALRAAV